MLTAKRVESAQGAVIHLEGTVDESTNFDQLLGEPPAKKVWAVHCGGISRMNSVGILGWMKYFGKAQLTGTQLVFLECSPIMVNQINSISNFTCGGKVHSIQLAFTCSGCSHAFVETHKSEDLKEQDLNEIPDRKCPKCGGPAPFDDFPEEYFLYLTRSE